MSNILREQLRKQPFARFFFALTHSFTTESYSSNLFLALH